MVLFSHICAILFLLSEINCVNVNASIEIQQSLLNDNFTMQASCSIVRFV